MLNLIYNFECKEIETRKVPYEDKVLSLLEEYSVFPKGECLNDMKTEMELTLIDITEFRDEYQYVMYAGFDIECTDENIYISLNTTDGDTYTFVSIPLYKDGHIILDQYIERKSFINAGIINPEKIISYLNYCFYGASFKLR